MSGKKVYMGEIMQSVVDALEPMVAEMQAVVSNTQYIRNLYDSSGIRSSATYSAADSTLIARKKTVDGAIYKADWLNDIGNNLVCAAAAVDMITTGEGAITKTCNFTVDTDGFETLLIDFKDSYGLAYTNTDIIIKMDGVQVATINRASPSTGTYTTTKSLDVTGKAFVEFEVNITTNKAIRFFADKFMLSNSAGDKRNLLYINGVKTNGQELTIADGYDNGKIFLTAPSGISVSKWDLLTFIIANNNDKTKVNIYNNSNQLVKANVTKDSYIGDIEALDIVVGIEIFKSGTTLPALQSIGYRYLT